MTVIRIVSVRTGVEVSRAVLADDGTVSYEGGDSARSAVLRQMRAGGTEAEAIETLARDGWSNGYLMVALDQP